MSKWPDCPVVSCKNDLCHTKCQALTDWEDVEQLTNVGMWCESCQTTHWSGRCDPDLDQQRMPR
jgi:hypothetical protein